MLLHILVVNRIEMLAIAMLKTWVLLECQQMPNRPPKHLLSHHRRENTSRAPKDCERTNPLHVVDIH